MRGATLFSCFCLISKGISIHAPHAGGDSGFHISIQPRGTFQSTPPMRGATGGLWIHRCKEKYFNPRPPCGGRLKPVVWISGVADFNPRPPCGGRLVVLWNTNEDFNFNPRPPCGGRPAPPYAFPRWRIFQSTPPMRGATNLSAQLMWLVPISIHAPHAGGDLVHFRAAPLAIHLNPRPPCGGRLSSNHRAPLSQVISIHAPHAGGDPCW